MTAVALITGASAGLGEEFARQVSARGHRLVLVARRKERLDALAAELGNARAVELGLSGRFAELDGERQREMIDLNCGALTELAHAVLPGMIERRTGGMLNVASTAAFQPGPGMAVYFATKAYVLSFTEALHEELKPHGIRVTALCPGPTRTEFGAVAGFGEGGSFDRFSADAESVVRAGLKALDKNRAVAVPGLLNKITAASTRFAPRPIARKIAGAIKF